MLVQEVLKLLKPMSVVLDEMPIVQLFFDHDLRERQRKRCIRGDARLDVLIAYRRETRFGQDQSI